MTTAERLAIILSWLMLSITALTQTTNNGNVLSVGQVSHGGSGGGAPLTYSARTDLCVTGSETGCAGLGLSFRMRTTDTIPFPSYPNGAMGAAATDPDFHSYMVMGSDWTVRGHAALWLGSGPTFNRDSTMYEISKTGGSAQVFLMDPATIHSHPAGTCQNSQTLLPCVAATSIYNGTVETNCGNNCTKLDNNGETAWSSTEARVLYELSSSGTKIYKLQIQPNCTMATPLACTFSRTLVLDFTSDTPVPCSILPSNYVFGGWTGSFRQIPDGSFAVAMGGAQDWLPNHSYTATDDIIFPQTNNSTKIKAYQAITSGTSGSTEPNWATTCYTVGQTCTGDGGVNWLNIGQITQQEHGFDLVFYNPQRGCSRLNTILGKVYRGTNQGANYPNPGTADASGTWVTDDDIICEQYGVTYPGTCPLRDTFQLHEGGGTGNSRFGTLTPSGSGSLNTCYTPGACSCSMPPANYRHAWSATTDYLASANDTIYDPAHDPHSLYEALLNSGPSYGGAKDPSTNPTYWKPYDSTCYSYFWDTPTTVVRPCMSRGSTMGGKCDSHPVSGYIYHWAGSPSMYPHLLARPSVGGAANPGVPTTIPGGLPGGRHVVYTNNRGGDVAPFIIMQTDVPTATYALGGNPPGSPPANDAWYTELIGASVDGAGTVYRFSHIYNSGSSPNFDVQNNRGNVSPDGQFADITSDFMGTRGPAAGDWQANHAYAIGDTMFPLTGNAGNYDFQILTAPTGNTGATAPTWCQTNGCTVSDGGVVWTNLGAACNQLRAMYGPSTSTAFSVGDLIFPATNNVSGNIYQATQAGTTYSALPNWGSLAPNWGNTVCDDAAHAKNQACSAGVVQWTNIGPNDCRSDVMLVDLLSAH